MPKRPWSLILLALLQFLTPVANVFFNAWALKVNPQIVVGWWLERTPLEIFETFALMPIAGLAILRMTRGSYFVFFGALVWNIIANLRYWDYATQTLPWASVALFSILNIGLVSYFLIPAVRRTYFDRRIRWWETKPRYEVNLATEVAPSQGAEPKTVSRVLEGCIVNISEGGALLRLKERLEIQDRVTLRFKVLTHDFEVECAIVHVRPQSSKGQTEYFYGTQFLHDAESVTRFRNLAVGLGLIGFGTRTQQKGMKDTLVEGVVDFLKTGSGLIPKN